MDQSLNKILIIQTAFIGDAILASSLVETWVNKYPETEIDILLRKGNETLFTTNPHIRSVLIWDKKNNKYKNLFDLVKKIRKAKYDAIINVQRFFATGYLSAFSGAKVISGYTNNPFSALFTHKIAFDTKEGKHEIERNACLIQPFVGNELKGPKLYPSHADYDYCQAYKDGKYVCIAPTSVWFTKQWPKENFIQLISSFDKETRVYLLGAPSDFEACEYIREHAQHDKTVNLAGKLSFMQSAALMKDAVMNYVNDSAPMHIASAMNAPTVAIYCSTLPSFGFGPLSTESRIVEYKGELACRPCGLHGKSKCPEGHFKCSDTLDQFFI